METRLVRTVALVIIAVAGASLLACDFGNLLGGAGSKPTISIISPTSGTAYHSGEDITIQSVAKDSAGVTRIELAVDGNSIRTDTPPIPQGQTSFSLVQKWQATPGSHTLSVRAFNSVGVASDPALVTITVDSVAVATAVPTSASPVIEPTRVLGVASPTAMVTATQIAGAATRTRAPATATKQPPTKAVATPTVSAPSGVYAESIRVDPPKPQVGVPPTFRVTFLNTTGAPVQYLWFVKIYEPDMPNSKGETSKITNELPVGRVELAAPADWKIGGGSPCTSFIARVFKYEQVSGQTSEFIKPDQSGGPAAPFQVCP
jgi:hypothetical protein